MRYLTVSLYHPRVVRGGAQYVAKDLHDAARADPGVEAVMLAAVNANGHPRYAKTGASITGLPDSPDEHLLMGRRFDDFYHVSYDPRRNKAVRRFLERHRPDVIHVHHSLWVGLEFVELARQVLPEARILYTLHEYLPICHARGQLYRVHERGICRDARPDQCTGCFPQIPVDAFVLRRRRMRRAFAMVDRFVAPSAYLRDRFVEWGLDAARIEVIPNGHRRRRPEGWEPARGPDANVFGFFGQYIDAKGIDVLLEAASRAARERPVEVRIFGGNKQFATEEYLGRIEAVLEAAPEGLTVTEAGPYGRENVFDLMASVDWVVVPSVWPETFGLVVSEAWDARRPVIASRAGGLGERIGPATGGIAVAPGSAGELAAAILRCAGNAELWQELSAATRDEIPVEEAWSRHKALAGA